MNKREFGIRFAVSLVLLLMTSLQVYSFTVDDLGFTFYYEPIILNNGRENGECCLSRVYTQNKDNKEWNANTDVTIPSTVVYRGKEYTVTSIGRSAMSNLICGHIYLPNTIREIGNYAFENVTCKSLQLPDSLDHLLFAFLRTTFTEDTPFVIPEKITTLRMSCCNIKHIVIKCTDKDIAYSIVGCEGTKVIEMTEGLTKINESMFQMSGIEKVKMPSSITVIEDQAFYGCDELTSIDIPEGITKIGNYAFCDCSALTSVNLPDGLEDIGRSAFEYCM